MARFDRDYYQRFYRDPRTQVYDQGEVERLCDFVCAYLDLLEIPVLRVLDLGCGLGYWRDALAERIPDARYTGVEISDYLCEEYGWQKGSVVDYRANGRFDLVVCQGVLQYLSRDEASAAIDNLARLCRGALYLEALTKEDWQSKVDQERTDGDVQLRSARWYRSRLGEHFQMAGGGMFVKRDGPAVLYALEALD